VKLIGENVSAKRKTASELRSQRWFSGPGSVGAHKHRRIKQAGFATEDFKDKPVIGILSTWSDFQTCHSHFPERIEDIKRGIWQAGGFPAVIPVQSVSESFLRPTSMLYRNLLAMEAEEAIRAHPIDGAVLLGGCDKTGPGLVMGAASANVPAIFVPAGAMLKGRWRQHTLGTGSSTWAAEADHRAGKINDREWTEMSEATVRSTGTCNTMGTASTMTALIDVLGLSLPGASTIPAVDSAHGRMASQAGRRIVEMVWEDLIPSDIVTPAALNNAVIADMAISGSTNSLIHLIAIARRFGHDLSLESFSVASDMVPVICNLMPAGKYLMEDLHFAGGLMAVLKSGTSYGTCVLHVCPESRIGGPLALVRDGDRIHLDAASRRLDLLVDEAEMTARRGVWKAPPAHYVRGYGSMFSEHVLQADQGCDFDYLARGGINPEPEIH